MSLTLLKTALADTNLVKLTLLVITEDAGTSLRQAAAPYFFCNTHHTT